MNLRSLPTQLTWVRIVIIPLFLIVHYCSNDLLSMNTKDIMLSAIFTIAGVTDYFDGYLARKWKQESNFGAFLDPVADKALVITTLITLLDLKRINILIAIIIILREMAVSALREWSARKQNFNLLNVSRLGKWKTGLQMTAIGLLLWNCPLINVGNINIFGYEVGNISFGTLQIGTLLIWAAVFLTVYSFVGYVKQMMFMFRE